MDSKNTTWKYVKKLKYAYPQKKKNKEKTNRKIKEKKNKLFILNNDSIFRSI